jgi:putative acetyltransferase
MRIDAIDFDAPAARALREEAEQELVDRYRSTGDPESRPDPREVLVFLVARDAAGAPLGGAALCAHDGTAEIKRLYVRPHARGRGVGGALLRRLEHEALERGYQAVRLETGLRQPEAIRLYERSGYRLIDDFGVYAGSPLVRSYERILR